MSLRMRGARGTPVRFSFCGTAVTGMEGETVAAALLAAGIRRGFFCAMGACQECLVEIGGETVEACRARVREGLAVESQGALPNSRSGTDRIKACFSEEKKQKTSVTLSRTYPAAQPLWKKVFWFFFSKKNRLS